MQLTNSTLGSGLEFIKSSVTLVNRTGSTIAVGDVVQVDLTQSSSSTTGSTQGADTSLYSGAVTPYTSGSPFVFYAIAMESVPDGRRFRATTQGRVLATVTAGAAFGPGDGMFVVRAGSRSLRAEPPNTNTFENVVGFNTTALTVSSQLAEIQFDGLQAFTGSLNVPSSPTAVTWLRDAGTASVSQSTSTAATFDLETGGVSTIANGAGGGIQVEQHTTNTAAGNFSGRITSATVTRGIMNPMLTMRVLIGASIQSIGLFFGFTDSTLSAVENTTTEKCAGFRYNTASSGNSTGFWTTVTNSNAGENATVTTAAIASSNVYELKVLYNSVTPSYMFYINGALVSTHTTLIPAVTDALLIEAVVTTKITALKRMSISYTRLQEGLITT